MIIRKKGSRIIIVGQDSYRWIITPSEKGILTLTVHHDGIKGQLLRINIESDINESRAMNPRITTRRLLPGF
ncbi:hypothetical protein A8709_18340 [Paenibacillus pectinilyticus]|uniref:Uncharacterized protein n=1 Tax=Paenibacillus pectinilyticus TaxID=512399 RepID=A0A1C0ZZI9_9BACL|nr:hypothetical protein A8709_18340 [Paenibacillus pectinilyticus]